MCVTHFKIIKCRTVPYKKLATISFQSIPLTVERRFPQWLFKMYFQKTLCQFMYIWQFLKGSCIKWENISKQARPTLAMHIMCINLTIKIMSGQHNIIARQEFPQGKTTVQRYPTCIVTDWKVDRLPILRSHFTTQDDDHQKVGNENSSLGILDAELE